MANRHVEQWLRDQPAEWLQRCAENEGGRARLCLEGYGSVETAVYFAREAARYANAYLDSTAGLWEAIERGDLHAVAGLTIKRGQK